MTTAVGTRRLHHRLAWPFEETKASLDAATTRVRPGGVGVQPPGCPGAEFRLNVSLVPCGSPSSRGMGAPFLGSSEESLEPCGPGQWGQDGQTLTLLCWRVPCLRHGPPWGRRSALRQPQFLSPSDEGRPPTCLPVAKVQGARARCLVLCPHLHPVGGTGLPRQRCVQEAGPPYIWRPQEAADFLTNPGARGDVRRQVPYTTGSPFLSPFRSCPRVNREGPAGWRRLRDRRSGSRLCLLLLGPLQHLPAPRPQAPVGHRPEQTRSCFPRLCPCPGPGMDARSWHGGGRGLAVDKPAVRRPFSRLSCSLVARRGRNWGSMISSLASVDCRCLNFRRG